MYTKDDQSSNDFRTHAGYFGLGGVAYGLFLSAAGFIDDPIVALVVVPLPTLLFLVFFISIIGQGFHLLMETLSLVGMVVWCGIALLPTLVLSVTHARGSLIGMIGGAIWCAVVAVVLDHYTGVLTRHCLMPEHQ